MNNDQFENYLREFQPRTPRALPPAALSPTKWRRLAAAASIALACGGSLWFLRQGKEPARRLQVGASNNAAVKAAVQHNQSFFVLTRTALEDPAALDAILEQDSRKSLPGFDQPQSTLRVLAKE